ncbi:MAG: NAD+ synthase [Deltaproteobacteria bacterium]|nr:NAD+ synthase [Candidatus Zymogenaceae bacterium]
MGILRIAQAQINTTVGDLGGNTAKVAQYIEQAREKNVDVVMFPELAICGYPPEDLLLKKRFVEHCRQSLEELIPKTRGITAVVGLPDQIDGDIFNAAALMHDGKLIDIYHKVELPNYGVFDEKRYFSRGKKPVVFAMESFRFMLTICEDIWIEGSIVEKHARETGANVCLCISASPFHAGKLDLRQNEVAAGFATRTDTLLFYNNLVGGQDELIFDGSSMVVTPDGKLLARGKRFAEELFITDIDESDISKKSTPSSTAPDDPAPVFTPLGGRKETRTPHVVNDPMDRIEEIYWALILGTHDYVTKNGFSRVVIGLSGGIDSALTAAIAAQAIGTENVTGITMPSQYTSNETRSDAELLAENLGINIFTVPIREIYTTYIYELSPHLGDGDLGVTGENLQARIRGNILMAFSNYRGSLVLTTGNKSETAVGYCTLYGDMAGGFAVIKDVPKTVVYEVSEFINDRSGREIIPQTTITRPPSAELRPDQKDEDSLPPYDVLDPILHAYVEEDMCPEEISELGFDLDLVFEVARMVDLNEYKRRQAPPGIKITPKAFGRDRRLPITNRYLFGLLEKNRKK